MLACPLCHKPLFQHSNPEKLIQCLNPICDIFEKPFLIRNDIPILIPPIGEYSIINPVHQFAENKTRLAGYNSRQTKSKDLKLRQKYQNIFYGFSTLEHTYYEALYSQLCPRAKVLIVGGGNIDTSDSTTLSWVNLFKSKDVDFCVTDIYLSNNIDYICDAHYLPFTSDCFDAVIITTVLEHVLSPFKVVKEIHRVLKDNGLLYATVPFVQCIHEGAYDFTRFTLSGQRWLFRYFEEDKSGYLIGGCCAMLYNLSTFVSLVFKQKLLGIFMRLLLWRICALIDAFLPRRIHINQGLCNYFLGKKSSKQAIFAYELPAYYRSKIN